MIFEQVSNKMIIGQKLNGYFYTSQEMFFYFVILKVTLKVKVNRPTVPLKNVLSMTILTLEVHDNLIKVGSKNSESEFK